jgi:hypothetical protein
VRGVCDPGRRHVRTVPELDRFGEPRAMGARRHSPYMLSPRSRFWSRRKVWAVGPGAPVSSHSVTNFGGAPGLEASARSKSELRNHWPPGHQ